MRERKHKNRRAPRAHKIWPSLIAGGLSLVGSVMGGRAADRGQRAANKSNERIAKENRAFQERMSSTAYQRSAKDLSAAGLNRILALGGPASTPAGAVATMRSETAGRAEALKTGTSSALQAKIAVGQYNLLKSQTLNVNQQTIKAAAETQLTTARSAIESEKARIVKDSSFNIRELLKEFGITTKFTEEKPYDPRNVTPGRKTENR